MSEIKITRSLNPGNSLICFKTFLLFDKSLNQKLCTIDKKKKNLNKELPIIFCTTTFEQGKGVE